MQEDNPLNLPAIEGANVSPGVAVGAVALSLALKWYDITIVKDGTMYQQYKMEGRTLQPADLAGVFDVARQFEQHLMGTPGRLSTMIVDALASGIEKDGFPQGPDHPGLVLRDNVLFQHGYDTEKASEVLDIPVEELTPILNGEKPIREDLAEVIEQKLGWPASQILEMQKLHDEYVSSELVRNNTA